MLRRCFNRPVLWLAPAALLALTAPAPAQYELPPPPPDSSGDFNDSGATPPAAADPPPQDLGQPPPPAAEPTAHPFIRPFPVIRVAGRFLGRRTRFTVVRVRAPRGARIAVTCRGRACPYRRRATIAARRRLRALERTFPAGTVLVIRVTMTGHIGKWTKIRVRRGAAPARADRCLMPDGSEPVRCPAG